MNVSLAGAAAPTRNPARWIILAAMILAVLMVALDGGMMALIAPSVARDLDADSSTINLIVSISSLMLAAFTLGGGVLGDSYGCKRLLLVGTIGVVVAAVLAMVAPSAQLLLPIRALDGIAAALVSPLALAIISLTFDEDERPKALGLYGAGLGVAGGLGTIVVQLLNQSFGWRSPFVLTIVSGAITLLLVLRFVPESNVSHKRVDWLGILLTAVGLFLLVYGINQASGPGGLFSPGVLLPALMGLVVFAILVVYSSRTSNPALQLALFKKPVFAVGILLCLFLGFAQMGVFFQLSTYLQSVLKVAPLRTGLILVPVLFSYFVFSIMAGLLIGKVNARLLLTGGILLFALAVAVLAFVVGSQVGFWTLLIPLILFGAGFSLANMQRVNLVLASAPPELAGSASATNNASLQLGNALGIAVMGVLLTTFARNAYFDILTRAGLSSAQIQRETQVLVAALQKNAGNVAAQFGITPQILQSYLGNYQQAYTSGLSQTLLVTAGVLLIGAVLAWFTFSTKQSTQGEKSHGAG